jgi:uncharacterized protein YcbX
MKLSVAALTVYPLKSGAGNAVPEVFIGRRGPAFDRVLMVVDERGNFLSQREHPELGKIRSHVSDESIELSGAGEVVRIDSAAGPSVKVRVWEDEVVAEDCGPVAAGFITHVLGRLARVVKLGAGYSRPVDARYAEGEVSFADGFPLLVATSASVAAIASAVATPIDARRFRPNLVIDGAEAFAEDSWRELAIGEVRLELVKPCARCVVVDLDPDRAVRAPGVLAALAQSRKRGAEVMFGQNAMVTAEGTIAVGAPVTVLR